MHISIVTKGKQKYFLGTKLAFVREKTSIKSVKQSHKNYLSAVNVLIGTKSHMKLWLLALLALCLPQLHILARLQLNQIKT
jgi:hypothetical protein